MKKLHIIISVIITLLLSVGYFAQAQTLGGGSGTINQLDQWRSTTTPSASIVPTVTNRAVRIPNLGSTGSPCVSVDSVGLLATTTCGSGGGTPAGTTTNLQYNNNGTFGGDSNFAYLSSTTLRLGYNRNVDSFPFYIKNWIATNGDYEDSFSVGFNNSVGGSFHQIAVGSDNVVATDVGGTFGYSNTVRDEDAWIFGHNNSVRGVRLLAMGINNIISGVGANAMLVGHDNTANGDGNQYGVGRALALNASDTSVFGQNITNTISGSTMIGNGDTIKVTILSDGETRANNFTGTTSAVNTFPNASTTNLTISNSLYDSASSAGTNGMVLKSTGTATQWVATSTLGITQDLSGYVPYTGATTAVNLGSQTFTTTGQTSLAGASTTNLTVSSDFYPKSGIWNSTGSVGIGSTSPMSILSIATSSGRINFGVPTSGFGAVGFSASTQTLANSSLYGNGTNTYLNAPTGGSVSIRTNNVEHGLFDSTSGLTVTGAGGNGLTVTTPGFTVFNFNSASGGIFRNNTGAFYIDQQTAGDVYFRVNSGGVTVITLKSTGNVGIIDTTPDFRFETNGSNTKGFFGITGTNDGDVLTVDTIGRFGIGTTTPTTNLQVTASTTNATTTVTIGKTGQNKGSCLELFDETGTAQYISIKGGALVVSTTSCK